VDALTILADAFDPRAELGRVAERVRIVKPACIVLSGKSGIIRARCCVRMTVGLHSSEKVAPGLMLKEINKDFRILTMIGDLLNFF